MKENTFNNIILKNDVNYQQLDGNYDVTYSDGDDDDVIKDYHITAQCFPRFCSSSSLRR